LHGTALALDHCIMKFEKITPGMTLLDIHSERDGNTTMRRLMCWKMQVISVDSTTRSAMVSWNGNKPQLYTEAMLTRLKDKPSKAYLEQEARRLARGGRMI
jgi:hypothetical protein